MIKQNLAAAIALAGTAAAAPVFANLGSDTATGGVTVSTSSARDSAGVTIDSTSDSFHNAAHAASASATLGAISAQQAGACSGVVTLTVSAI